MSANLTGTPSKTPPPLPLVDLALWLAVGAAGIAVLFAGSVQVPQKIKLVGLYGVGLGTIAGWGLGRWAIARHLQRPLVVATLTWGLIAAGEALAAVQSHRRGLAPEGSDRKQEQVMRDLLSEGEREYYANEPEGLAKDELARWRAGRDFFERGERRHREQRDAIRLQRSFYGYLANRIDEKKWGKWCFPWPALFWGAEVVLGSTLGAWLAFRAVRGVTPPTSADVPKSNFDHEVQDSRG